MWNSTSSVTEKGTKFEVGQLDLFINFLGLQIEIEEDNADNTSLPKDAENSFHSNSFLTGITNGEYLYCAVEIITEMLSDEPAKDPPMYKEAVLASILDAVEVDFLERVDDNCFDEKTARDIWNLWAVCRANNKMPPWEDEDGKPAQAPSLEKIDVGEWGNIFEFIRDEFLWDRDWEISIFGENFALVKEQPYWPDFQEYRTAKTWLTQSFKNINKSK